MKMIVGLGNPGEKYSKNRHNVGFMVVDVLSTKYDVQSTKWGMNKKFNAEMVQIKDVMLVKPQTFMNDSGVAVSAIANFYKINPVDIYIVHDDLDIALGSYKIAKGKGPKVHNGLSSVIEKIGTNQYTNVRVGVENREVRGNGGIPGVVYSLQDFNDTERKIVDDVIAKIVEELMRVVS